MDWVHVAVSDIAKEGIRMRKVCVFVGLLVVLLLAVVTTVSAEDFAEEYTNFVDLFKVKGKLPLNVDKPTWVMVVPH